MFGIPEIEKRIFRNDFINNVIVSGEYSNNRSCAEHRQTLKQRYAELLPIQSDNPQQHYRFNIDMQTKQTSINANVDETERHIALRSKNMQQELVMTNSAFQYRESGQCYDTSTTFNTNVGPLIDYLGEVGVERLNTLRLRKVNAVGYELSTTTPAQKIKAWQPAENFINERLVPQYEAMLGAAPAIKQHLSTIQLIDGHYTLIVKYGYYVVEKNSDGSNVKGQVIIDLDIARHIHTIISDIHDELDRMHQELYNAFLWSISEKFIALLNQEGGQ